MRIAASSGCEDVATVFLGEVAPGRYAEFVESVCPPIPREEKWVLIVSTLCGCPVGCRFCDAGSQYLGPLSADEILGQIDFLVRRRFPEGSVPVKKFKVQFARMGEPALNNAVLEVLVRLKDAYDAQGLVPCLSTIAPRGRDGFFEDLLDIKRKFYRGRFQLQFSLHTTEGRLRDWLIPWSKWTWDEIGSYGETFREEGDLKITLNFAAAEGMPIEPEVLLRHFSTEGFLVKMTPVNPTYEAKRNKLSSCIRSGQKDYRVVERLREAGYEVIVSVGEPEENSIGSNCGQQLARHLNENSTIEGAYTYPLQAVRDPYRVVTGGPARRAPTDDSR